MVARTACSSRGHVARALRCAFPKCGGCDPIRLPHRLADRHRPDTSAKRRTAQAHCTRRWLHTCNGAHTHLHAENRSESFRVAVPTWIRGAKHMITVCHHTLNHAHERIGKSLADSSNH